MKIKKLAIIKFKIKRTFFLNLFFLILLKTIFLVKIHCQELAGYPANYCISATVGNVEAIGKSILADDYSYLTSIRDCDVVQNVYARKYWEYERQYIVTFKGSKSFGLGYLNKRAFDVQKGVLISDGFKKFREFDKNKLNVPGFYCELTPIYKTV